MNLKIIIFILIIAFVILCACVLYSRFGANEHIGGQDNQPWATNIEKDTINNEDWRNVIYTSDKLQVALMSVPPKQELGAEIHPDNDQFFRIESGTGELITGDNETRFALSDGFAAVVPRGIKHNVRNLGNEPLKLYTIYGPPHHPPHTVDRTHGDEIKREAAH